MNNVGKMIIFLLFFVLVSSHVYASLILKSETELKIYNPYFLSAVLEVKCDYNNLKKKFDYHTFIVVPKQNNTTIHVRSDLKRCQIWPKLRW